MSITFGTEAAAAILEFDLITHLLEEEAADHKANGWVFPAVDANAEDGYRKEMTPLSRKRTLSRLVELGYWKRDEEGYYCPIKWLFREEDGR